MNNLVRLGNRDNDFINLTNLLQIEKSISANTWEKAIHRQHHGILGNSLNNWPTSLEFQKVFRLNIK